jgi:hypothetical protein
MILRRIVEVHSRIAITESAMTRKLLLAASAVALAGALATGFQFPSAVADDQAAAAPASGHCDFSLKNQWAGPFKACSDPATPDQCKALGAKDENSNAVWSSGSCPTAGIVGTCRKSDGALHYYEGDAAGLEMGCGFQSGEWQSGK